MERWATVKRIHQAALEHDGDRRAAFLDAACAGDAAIRRDVESLLAYEDKAKSFLEAPAMDVAAKSLPIASDTRLLGRTLGHYHVQSLWAQAAWARSISPATHGWTGTWP